MENIIFCNKSHSIDVTIDKDTVTIKDAPKTTSITQMSKLIDNARESFNTVSPLHTRSKFTMINEWRVYNLLHSLNIYKDKSGTLVLNNKQPWYKHILYMVLSLFYLEL